MPHMLSFLQWAPRLIWLVFTAAFGACVGSLINVLAYRMPRGINVVWPPSRCPSCSTRLSWRDNIPVVGWVVLRGRCRYCRQPISPEYPLVEAAVSLLFVVVYVLYFLVPPETRWLGLDWGAIAPEWARNDATRIWPTFVLLLMVLGSLSAMTLVDAKTFTIPLTLTWTPAVLALAVHPAHAAWIEASRPLRHLAPGWDWVIPTPGAQDWWWIGASIGGAVGLVVSMGLLASGLIGRSFADYDEWERSAQVAEAGGVETLPVAPSALQTEPIPDAQPTPGGKPASDPLLLPEPATSQEPALTKAAVAMPSTAADGVAPPPPPDGFTNAVPGAETSAVLSHSPERPSPDQSSVTEPLNPPPVHPATSWWPVGLVAVIVMAACAAAGGALAKHFLFAAGGGVLFGLAMGGVVSGFAVRVLGLRQPRYEGLPPEGEPSNPTQMWLEYPHARREMVREAAFLASPVLLAAAGGFMAARLGIGSVAPLWLLALTGVLMGYLIGGGVVWLFRIGGSLGVGREAMGMGDVHLMAGVGAALGWIDATIAFFVAAFVGLYWTAARRAWSGRLDRAMPFGPNLAAATVLVLLAKPAIESGLGMIAGLGRAVSLP